MTHTFLRGRGGWIVSACLLVAACSGSGSNSAAAPAPNVAWAWMAGASTIDALAITSGSTVPGARLASTSWTDASGNLWLFGGYGYDNVAADSVGLLSDLWEYVPATGTWALVAGVPSQNSRGSYGSMGTAGGMPSARQAASGWVDTTGKLWLFGGSGYDSAGKQGELNDLWTFNPVTNQWTWVGGSNVMNALPITSGATANPGARDSAATWSDSSGNIWLFGGSGFDVPGDLGDLNDLWRFSPGSGTWVLVSAGAVNTAVNISGSYGNTVATPGTPGSRESSNGWTDAAGNIWIFGGLGFDSTGAFNDLNDLWKYTPAANTWTWVGGSHLANARGVYGSLGTGATTNMPGARSGAISWNDASGNFWLFGGYGDDATIASVNIGGVGLNDNWEYNSTANTWTWVSGATTGNATGTYGSRGAAANTNTPGARSGAVVWTTSTKSVWLFGGQGFATDATTPGYLNDLWELTP